VTPSTPRTRHLFLVELWREPREGAPGSLRGIVKHLAHHEECYVAALADVTVFIARRIDAVLPPGEDRPIRTEFGRVTD
jgi:hypothetical protein